MNIQDAIDKAKKKGGFITREKENMGWLDVSGDCLQLIKFLNRLSVERHLRSLRAKDWIVGKMNKEGIVQ